MSRFKLVTTAKAQGVGEAAVSAAAKNAYPEYRVAKVEDLGDKWQIRLDLKESTRKRKAAEPPAFLKEKDDAGADSADDSDASDSEDSDSEDSDKSDDEASDSKDKGEGDKKDPVKAIESVINELKGLLDQLGGHASDLKDKADKVDEIHDLTKGDVAPTDDVPPVPPVDDAAIVGPTPGAPKPPRKSPVPTGKAPMRPGMGPGVPGVFGSRQTEIVEHPMKDDDGEYSLADVEAAIKAHPDLQNYAISEVRPVENDNVYVAKLTRK